MSRFFVTLGRQLLQIVVYAAGIGAVLILLGLAYAEIGDFPLHHSIASALFLGGGAIVILFGLTGGGAIGKIVDAQHLGARIRLGTPMPFTPVLVGVAVIGIGVLSLYV